MKYVDEYRDAEKAKQISGKIEELTEGQPFKMMEVCGGHTHTIYKHGIEDVLPRNIDLIHGPGCPVCVLPMAGWMMPSPSPKARMSSLPPLAI